MSYYFGFFVVVSAIMTLCAFVTYDATMGLAGKPLPHPQPWEYSCTRINDALLAMGWGWVVELAVSTLLAVSIANIMRSKNWAWFGLISVYSFLFLLIAKLGLLFMGVLFIWGRNSEHCQTQIHTLYQNASAYMIAYTLIFVFQACFGLSFMVCCGIKDATTEATQRILEDEEAAATTQGGDGDV